jgi:hypothetical protein
MLVITLIPNFNDMPVKAAITFSHDPVQFSVVSSRAIEWVNRLSSSVHHKTGEYMNKYSARYSSSVQKGQSVLSLVQCSTEKFRVVSERESE